jgi:ssRNA-specific RNase YbeY (16S rRNA maturation enzyme)
MRRQLKKNREQRNEGWRFSVWVPRDLEQLLIPYEKIKSAILGTSYDLSVAALSAGKARPFNKKYLGKSYVPDVLAFPRYENEGEILLNVRAL